MSEEEASTRPRWRAFKYPVPAWLSVVFVVWMAQFASFMGEDTWTGDFMEFRLSVGLGLIMAFFLTLGVSRYHERQARAGRHRVLMLSLAVVVPIVLAVGTQPFLELLAALEGTSGSVDLVSDIRWQIYVHLLAVSVCAAFVMPYADGRSGNDWFIYWTLASLQAIGIGVLLAGLAWLVLNLLGMLLQATLPGVLFSIVFWATLLPFGLLLPMNVLGGLPSIMDRPGSPPPMGRWMQLLARQIVLPAWIGMFVLGYVLLAQQLGFANTGDRWLLIIVGTLIAGKITSVTYLVALRDGRENAVAELWRRWQFALLLPALAIAIFGLIFRGGWQDLGVWLPFVGASLTWLLLSSVQATIRAQPRVTFFAWAYIICVGIGTVAAVPALLFVDGLDAVERRGAAKPAIPTEQTTWPHASDSRAWPGDVWTLTTWASMQSSREKQIDGLDGNPEFTVRSAISGWGEEVDFFVNKCRIAMISRKQLYDLKDEPSRPVFVADHDHLHLMVQFNRVTFGQRNDTWKLERIESMLWMMTFRQGARPNIGSCPEPVRLRALPPEGLAPSGG